MRHSRAGGPHPSFSLGCFREGAVTRPAERISAISGQPREPRPIRYVDHGASTSFRSGRQPESWDAWPSYRLSNQTTLVNASVKTQAPTSFCLPKQHGQILVKRSGPGDGDNDSPRASRAGNSPRRPQEPGVSRKATEASEQARGEFRFSGYAEMDDVRANHRAA
jgi:hypothetical protein